MLVFRGATNPSIDVVITFYRDHKSFGFIGRCDASGPFLILLALVSQFQVNLCRIQLLVVTQGGTRPKTLTSRHFGLSRGLNGS